MIVGESHAVYAPKDIIVFVEDFPKLPHGRWFGCSRSHGVGVAVTERQRAKA
jgi:hypothetical protein